MLAAIDMLLSLFGKRARDVDVIDKAIDNLHQSDTEIEARLRELRARVEVYQRGQANDETHDG